MSVYELLVNLKEGLASIKEHATEIDRLSFKQDENSGLKTRFESAKIKKAATILSEALDRLPELLGR